MNIKNIIPKPILSIEPKTKVESKVRSEASSDRDANGRREQAEPELKRHLTAQEFDDAMKTLSELPGLKANDLILQVEHKENVRTILIVDRDGKVIRRLSESQLWSTTRDKDRQTGKLLDKAM